MIWAVYVITIGLNGEPSWRAFPQESRAECETIARNVQYEFPDHIVACRAVKVGSPA